VAFVAAFDELAATVAGAVCSFSIVDVIMTSPVTVGYRGHNIHHSVAAENQVNVQEI